MQLQVPEGSHAADPELFLRLLDFIKTKARKIELYLRQGDLFFQFAPEVESRDTLFCIIPLADTHRLRAGSSVQVQLALTDGDGNPLASEIASVAVDDLLKEEGYDAS